MVKIEPVNGQNTPLPEKKNAGELRDHQEASRGSDKAVRVSEEGMKKHIFGQLMARISEEAGAKGKLTGKD